MSAKGDKTHRYNVRLQEGTAEALAEIAARLDLWVDTPGRYYGDPSAGDFLDMLAEKFRENPTAVLDCLRGVGIEGEPLPEAG